MAVFQRSEIASHDLVVALDTIAMDNDYWNEARFDLARQSMGVGDARWIPGRESSGSEYITYLFRFGIDSSLETRSELEREFRIEPLALCFFYLLRHKCSLVGLPLCRVEEVDQGFRQSAYGDDHPYRKGSYPGGSSCVRPIYLHCHSALRRIHKVFPGYRQIL